MNIPIADAGANLRAFRRMDGAWWGSIDISMRKARTARFFEMESGTVRTLGVSGDSVENDRMVAQAGVDALV